MITIKQDWYHKKTKDKFQLFYLVMLHSQCACGKFFPELDIVKVMVGWDKSRVDILEDKVKQLKFGRYTKHFCQNEFEYQFCQL